MLVFVFLFEKCGQESHTFLGGYENLITNRTRILEH